MPFLRGFVTTEHKHPGGRPKGIIRRNCITHGAYSKDFGDVLSYWRKKYPGNAARVEEIITSFLSRLGWKADHERYIEVRDVAILTVSRGALLVKVLDVGFTRTVKDPDTGARIKDRPADQLTRLLEMDVDIDSRMKKLGLYPVINKK